MCLYNSSHAHLDFVFNDKFTKIPTIKKYRNTNIEGPEFILSFIVI